MIRRLVVSAALTAMVWPGLAAAAWHQASSAHFVVYSDDKPENVRAFAERLERFDKALRLIRGVPDDVVPDAARVRVFRIGTVQTISDLFSSKRNMVAGFYNERVEGAYAFVPQTASKGAGLDLDGQSILFHEYTHHFMHRTWPDAVFPPWLSEGFAEFHATAIFANNGEVTIGQYPAYRASLMAASYLLPVDRLLLLNPGKLDDEQVAALYSRGWLLTHLLTFSSTRTGQLSQYINTINAGKPIDEAVKAFGDLGKLDREMTQYAQNRSISVARLSPAMLPIGTVAVRALDPGEAAVMPALVRSTRGVDPTAAIAVVKLARTLAAPYPNNAAAQNELGEAEFDAGNLVEAEAAIDRALAADGKSVHALMYKGKILTTRLAKAGDKDAARWSAARQWFAKANKVDPDDPWPLWLYYDSFFKAGQIPTANAEDGVLAAYFQSPGVVELRMTATQILLQRSNKAAARRALQPIAFAPHRGALAATARKAIDAIDAGHVDEALRILTSPPTSETGSTASITR